MPKFRDNAGREWRVSIDVFLMELVEERTGVSFDDLFDDDMKPFARLLKKRVVLVRVLWVLVEDQAKALGVTPEQFGRALGGDSLGEAAVAFVEALADFSPSHQRQILRALVAKGNELTARTTERALLEIAAIDPDRSASATSSPASSAGSSPAPSGG
jgi:hypothetical protein